MIKLNQAFKLIAVMILCFCAVLIFSVFFNYMLDLQAVKSHIPIELIPAYEGKMTMAKIICACAGGMLGAVTLIVLIYSVGRFISKNSASMGVMKAMGYGEWQCAFRFITFGASILVSATAAYFAAYFLSPLFYDNLGDVVIKFGFNIETILLSVVMPTVLFSLFSVLYARLRLRKKPLDLIADTKKIKVNKLTVALQKKGGERTFLKDLKRAVTFNNLSLIFFVGFAALAFSTQIQMAISITEYAEGYASPAILISLGLVLGLVTLIVALSFVVDSNKKYLALLKAYGYTERECGKALLGGYRIVAYIGFIIGTAYKYGLMFILIDVFTGQSGATVKFDYIGLLITIAAFALFYELILLLYKRKISLITLKGIMQS